MQTTIVCKNSAYTVRMHQLGRGVATSVSLDTGRRGDRVICEHLQDICKQQGLCRYLDRTTWVITLWDRWQE